MTYEEMYPCRAQIIRTKAGRENAPLDDYRYPSDSGEFTGTLSFRCWHPNNKMLLCYVQATCVVAELGHQLCAC